MGLPQQIFLVVVSLMPFQTGPEYFYHHSNELKNLHICNIKDMKINKNTTIDISTRQIGTKLMRIHV